MQVPRAVLVKQSISHPDCPGEASLNLASGAALERSPLEIISNNGGVKHVSTESELGWRPCCVFALVPLLEALILPAGATTGTTGLLEGMETKLRDGIKDSLATNKRDLNGM